MHVVSSALRRYPIVAITLAVGAVGGALALAGLPVAAQWVVSAFALVIAAMQATSMIKGLLGGRWGIDILAVVAILATIAVGEYWASLVICLMLSGGEALEDYAAGRAKRELSALLDRAPQLAHRLVGDGPATEDVAIGAVAIGDRLLVRPAEVVPVDGALESPHASFDESSLTGESIPVDRVAGDGVWSGSVNGQGAITIRATALAAESQYQRIVALVAEATESQAPLVRLADRYAVPFTAVSLAIAGLAWFLSGDPVRFAEVLVVATPCPLLLAAPIAFMGGMSRAAGRGVIVKGAGAIEQLGRARSVAFDKTGTLTHGTPTVVAVRPAPGFAEAELLSLVASAEQYSSHTLAASIVETARARGLELHAAEHASEREANGVSATILGRAVIVGKRSYVAEHASGVEAATLEGGQLAVYAAVDGEFAGVVILSDTIRPESAATVAALRSLGVRDIVMLTGDGHATAEHVASAVGVTDVRAELLPRDKVEAVRALAARPVVMVGDGVNDAPVLAVAEVGIAMGARGATAASESADVVILVDDIARTVDALAIGRRTLAVANQSIWLGIGLSVGLMIVSAFGVIPAIVGAGLQEFVDLATILNALRALGAARTETRPEPSLRPRPTVDA